MIHKKPYETVSINIQMRNYDTQKIVRDCFKNEKRKKARDMILNQALYLFSSMAKYYKIQINKIIKTWKRKKNY